MLGDGKWLTRIGSERVRMAGWHTSKSDSPSRRIGTSWLDCGRDFARTSGSRPALLRRWLLRAAEDWARSQGCIEMASDTAIDNQVSQRAHEALGFEVAERSVLYPKTLW